MNVTKRAYGSAAIFCLILLTWPTASSAATELLYVREGRSLITYSVNASTAGATKLGTPLALPASLSYPIEIIHAPSAPFVYILGFTSANHEYLWVHSTTAQGIPTVTPIQTLAVKPALTQFALDPKGNFAYGLYAWVDINGNTQGDVVLFTVNPKTGMLVNTAKATDNFPTPNCGGWEPPSIYGFNSTASKLYTVDGDSGAISYSTVNSKTGMLGKSIVFANTGPDCVWDAPDYTTVISDKLAATETYEEFDDIYIQQNPLATQSYYPGFDCSTTLCQDHTIPQFDPSGKYLFLIDGTIESVVVVRIDLVDKQLVETGSSIPGAPSILSFSPDGTIVYAVEGKEVLIYAFDALNGTFKARSSISSSVGVNEITPAQ